MIKDTLIGCATISLDVVMASGGYIDTNLPVVSNGKNHGYLHVIIRSNTAGSHPVYTQPVQPVQPMYAQPVQPMYAQPVQPMYVQPVQPGYPPQGIYGVNGGFPSRPCKNCGRMIVFPAGMNKVHCACGKV